MSYEFGHLSLTGSTVILRSRQEVSYTSSHLPAGPRSQDYYLTCIVQAFDAMSAVSSARRSIPVLEKENFSVDELDEFLATGLRNAEGVVDVLKNVLVTASGALGITRCDNAPGCTAINREECTVVENTCGQCLSGYVGEEGHGNSPCIHQQEARRRLTTLTRSSSSDVISCVLDSDCHGIFQVCSSSGVCAVTSRSCPRDCSGHGKCTFVSLYNSSSVVEKCSVLDSACVARCVCDADFGGPLCSLTVEEYTQRLATRHAIAEGIRDLTLSENTAADTVKSWVASLAALAHDAESLREDTKVLMGLVAFDVMERAMALTLSVEDLNGIDVVVDFALTVTQTAQSAGAKQVFDNLLQRYSEFALSDMVEGQNAVSIIGSYFRMSSFVVSDNDGRALSTGTTALEAMGGKTAQSVTLPPTCHYPVQASVIETRPMGALNSTFIAAPIGVTFMSSPCNVKENCEVVVVLQNVKLSDDPTAVQHNTSAEAVTFTTTCKDGVDEVFEYDLCPGGAPIAIRCDGIFAGQVTTRCPTIEQTLLCVSLGPGAAYSSCRMDSYTEHTTTCICSMGSVSLQATAGQSEDDSPDTTVSVEFSAVTASLLSDFTSTWKSADELSASDVAAGWQVLMTCVLLGASFTAFAAVGHFRDSKHNSLMRKEEALITVGSGARKVLSGGKLNMKRRGSAKNRLIQQEFNRIENSLPSVLRSDSFWNKYMSELKIFHRWVGIYFYYSPVFPRSLRVLSLCSTVIVMLFVEAVTYNIADPDDGSCEVLKSEVECFSKKSVLSSDESMCYWESSSAGGGSCHYKDIENDMNRVVVVAIASAIASTPFALAMQFLIGNILGSGTKTSKSSTLAGNAPALEEDSDEDEGTQAKKRWKHAVAKIVQNGKATVEECTGNTVLEDFNNLLNEIRLYRDSLTEAKQRDFDGKQHIYTCPLNIVIHLISVQLGGDCL